MLLIAEESGALHLIGWLEEHARAERSLVAHAVAGHRTSPASNPGGVSAALRAYFDGQLAAIDALPVAAIGTPFQREVWSALRGVP